MTRSRSILILGFLISHFNCTLCIKTALCKSEALPASLISLVSCWINCEPSGKIVLFYCSLLNWDKIEQVIIGKHPGKTSFTIDDVDEFFSCEKISLFVNSATDRRGAWEYFMVSDSSLTSFSFSKCSTAGKCCTLKKTFPHLSDMKTLVHVENRSLLSSLCYKGVCNDVVFSILDIFWMIQGSDRVATLFRLIFTKSTMKRTSPAVVAVHT